MDIMNLPIEERRQLFQKWLDDNAAYNHFKLDPKDLSNEYNLYLLCGHDYVISKEDLENPNFILLEWNEGPADWMRSMSSKIGSRCEVGGTYGIFLSFNVTYEDYYYRIQEDNRRISLITCVAAINFIND